MKFPVSVKAGTPEEHRTLRLAAFILILFYALDQITKFLVVKYVHDLGTRFIVIPGFFDITYVQNRGAAWGILSGRLWLLMTISFAVFALLLLLYRKLCEGWVERYYALALIGSGILGNCTDRIARGAVVDFLRFYVQSWEWPSFNVADSAICVGVTVFIISTLFRPEQKKINESKNN